jgi:hypothetical protein
MVTGVAARAPSNSSIQFDFVASLSTVVSMAAKDSADIGNKLFSLISRQSSQRILPGSKQDYYPWRKEDYHPWRIRQIN